MPAEGVQIQGLESARPNVVLVVCDQLRGDCLGYAGHPDVKTPFLDTLAAQGTFFEAAHAACPSCIPARASLLTGQTPRTHGRVGYQDGIPWNYEQMMPQAFADAGYQTALVGKMHVHPPRKACGFQHLRLHDGYIGFYRKASRPHWMHQDTSDDYLRFLRSELGPEADVNHAGVENNSWVARPWPYEERLHPTNWVVDEAIRFLETRDRTRPFFLMASFVRPHPPFDPPATYFERYLARDLREPARGDWDDVEATERDGMLVDSPHGCRDEALRHEAMAGYYGCVTHVDHQIGRLVTALENDETFENTVFVFTADHGEMLFDHSSFRKVLPYEGSTRIPLIVRVGSQVLPGGRPAPRRSGALAELRDVMPTLLEAVGAPVPEGVEGLSLLGEVTGEAPLCREWLHGEHSGSREQSNQWILRGTEKYVWFTQTGVERFFDLSTDPREERDLASDPAWAGRVAELRAILASELEGREEGYAENGRLVAGRRPRVVLGL